MQKMTPLLAVLVLATSMARATTLSYTIQSQSDWLNADTYTANVLQAGGIQAAGTLTFTVLSSPAWNVITFTSASQLTTLFTANGPAGGRTTSVANPVTAVPIANAPGLWATLPGTNLMPLSTSVQIGKIYPGYTSASMSWWRFGQASSNEIYGFGGENTNFDVSMWTGFMGGNTSASSNYSAYSNANGQMLAFNVGMSYNYNTSTYGQDFWNSASSNPANDQQWHNYRVEFNALPSSNGYTNEYVDGVEVLTSVVPPTEYAYDTYDPRMLWSPTGISPTALGYMVLGGLTQTAHLLYITGLQPGIQWTISSPMAIAAGKQYNSVATASYLGVSTTSVTWNYDVPTLTLSALDTTSNEAVGTITTTGLNDGLIGNSVEVSVLYPQSYWVKTFNFGAPIPGQASLQIHGSTPANTSIRIDASVNGGSFNYVTSGTLTNLGSTIPLAGSVFATTYTLKLTLISNTGSSPIINYLELDYPNPVPTVTPTPATTATMTPTITQTARPDLPFTAFNYPNPFKADGSTTTMIVLNRPMNTTMHILDVAGNELYSAPPVSTDTRSEWLWNGTDSTGKLLPSGVYLARFDGADGVILKIALLRSK